MADGHLCQFPPPSPKTQGISSQPNRLCPTLLLAFRVAQRIGEGAHDRSFFLFFKHTHTQSLCFSEAKFCHGDLGVGVEGAWLLILPSISRHYCLPPLCCATAEPWCREMSHRNLQ